MSPALVDLVQLISLPFEQCAAGRAVHTRRNVQPTHVHARGLAGTYVYISAFCACVQLLAVNSNSQCRLNRGERYPIPVTSDGG